MMVKIVRALVGFMVYSKLEREQTWTLEGVYPNYTQARTCANFVSETTFPDSWYDYEIKFRGTWLMDPRT
jgi:hypothetical protein